MTTTNVREKRSKASYMAGPYAPVESESEITGLEVVGEIPEGLSGMFLQNAPNPRFEPEGAYHWFDGDGMVHGVELRDGKASYRNRWIETSGLQADLEAGRALSRGILEPIDFGRTGGPDKDTANTDLTWHQGRLYATWYLGGQPYELSAPGLKTQGIPGWAKDMPCGVASHGKVCPTTGEMIFFDFSFYEPPYVHVGVLGADGRLKNVTAVPSARPTFYHDIAITERHTILLDLPMLWRQDKLKQGKRRIHFDDDAPSRFGVLPRYAEGGEIRWFEAPSSYVYHTINAWEDGDEIVMTGCRIASPLPKLPPGAEPEVPHLYFLRLVPFLWEWRFNLTTGQMTERQLDDVPTEFPRMNDDALGRKSRFSYNPRCAREPTLLFDGLIKYDLDSGNSQTHEYGTDRFGTEAVFAPAQDSKDEEDGWVVVLVQDRRQGSSELKIIDPHDFAGDPVATVKIPTRVPLGFHACWAPLDDQEPRS